MSIYQVPLIPHDQKMEMPLPWSNGYNFGEWVSDINPLCNLFNFTSEVSYGIF